MELLVDPCFTPGATLCEEESLHCIKVMRHRVGDQVHVTDGNGNRFLCKIIVADARGCSLDVLEQMSVEPPKHFLHMAVAPTKNIDRFEWFVEKAVEMGVSRITPISCEHSERTKLRLDRLQRIVVAACKQSLKFHIPQIDDIVECKTLISDANEEQKFILHCEDAPKEHLFNAAKPNRSSLVLIGPEGDFSLNEIKMANDKGFIQCSLGPERLRTETAALAATNIVDVINHIN